MRETIGRALHCEGEEREGRCAMRERTGRGAAL
jgi:hypothetical protein